MNVICRPPSVRTSEGIPNIATHVLMNMVEPVSAVDFAVGVAFVSFENLSVTTTMN